MKMNETNKNVEDNQQNTSKYNQRVKQNGGNEQYKKDFNRKPITNQPQQKPVNAEDLAAANNQRKELYPPRREPRREYIRNDNVKIKVEETKEDIARDIQRIEKEIDLEIKEITTMRLGL